MSSAVLGTAGSIIGGALGGPIGAAIGGAIGASIGGVIDSHLFAPNQDTTNRGAPIANVPIQESREGAAIPRVFGMSRVSGQVIWQTKYREIIKTTETTVRTGKFGRRATNTQHEYIYTVSCAIGICEGPIHGINRIWADGNVIDMDRDLEGDPIEMDLYLGTEDQTPNAHIVSKEGADATPAYRGLAYVVFRNLLLSSFGNRIPQFQFEVVRSGGREVAGSMEQTIRAVNLIPGSGEFVYGTTRITATAGTLPYYDPEEETTGSDGGSRSEVNRVNTYQRADFPFALDQMQTALQHVQSTALTVAWFVDDLRCGHCLIRPRNEDSTAETSPSEWSVGIYRRNASGTGPERGTEEVTRTSGRLNYGGTPSDSSVVEAIRELKRRGFRVMFYPYLFTDIPLGNTLPNPYPFNNQRTGQSAHPGREFITSNTNRAFSGTDNGTAAIDAQVAGFFVGYNIMIGHYANLCVSAGGVDTFLIGSGMSELNRLQNASGAFPAIAHWISLATAVKNLLGANCRVGYAADWAEWNGFSPRPGDFYYPLDALYAHSDIDFIGINNHMPLTDWRDGRTHLDWREGRSIYDIDYLQAGINGGINFDWIYSTEADRNSQTRTPLTDPSYNKPWMFRRKDLRSWWQNRHYERRNGVEQSTHTAWVPRSKQIWFTELGCPAVDKGTNQPDAFFDPKSTSHQIPYFSRGNRDDLIHRRFIEAHQQYWRRSANNPRSNVYNGSMVNVFRMYVWAWDCRPFPFYPKLSYRWGDTANWSRSSWLNGRAGLCDIKNVIREVMAYQGFTRYNVDEVQGMVSGFSIDRIMSVRQILELLSSVFFFDGVESNGVIHFRRRAREPVTTIDEEDLVVSEDDSQSDSKNFEVLRGSETDLPSVIRLGYQDMAADYKAAQVYSRRVGTDSLREDSVSFPLNMEQADASGVAEAFLIERWVGRETGSLTLPPSDLAYEPGDILNVRLNGRLLTVRIDTISEFGARKVEFTQVDRSTYDLRAGPQRPYDGRQVI